MAHKKNFQKPNSKKGKRIDTSLKRQRKNLIQGKKKLNVLIMKD